MRIVQMDRRQRLIRDEAGVIARFGVAPTSISDYLALVGDAADGYPGLRGWGAKSTAAVLSRFNHLEGIPVDSRESRVDVMYPAALTKRGGLERLCADASGAGAIFEGMARVESTVEVDYFVFPSLLKDGKVPIRASTFVQNHLRPAAVSVGVVLAKGQRSGLHNLRHSLSTWLVNKGKVDPKTVQGMLRHSDIRTTMNLYTQDDRDEKQAAQGAFLSAVDLGRRLVQ